MVGISGQAIADIDLSGYNTKSPIKITHEGTSLSAEWHSNTEIKYLIKIIQRYSSYGKNKHYGDNRRQGGQSNMPDPSHPPCSVNHGSLIKLGIDIGHKL